MKKKVQKLEAQPLRVAMIAGGTRTPQHVIDRFKAGWEMWGLNAIYPAWTGHIEWSRRFNLHRWDHLVRDWRGGLRSEISMMQLQPKVPLYVLDGWRKGALPNQKILTREMLAELPRGGQYHAGSFDIMVAFALTLGAKEISLHGISLAWDSWREEPISARACLEYWIGVAEGRGCKVSLFDCDLFYQYHLVRSQTVYGWDDVKLMEERDIPRFDPRP